MESGILIYARQRMPMWLVLRKTDSCLWACHICDMCHFSHVTTCCWDSVSSVWFPRREYSLSLCLVSSELHPVCLFPLLIFLCICSLYYVLSLSTTLCWVLWVLVAASHRTLNGCWLWQKNILLWLVFLPEITFKITISMCVCACGFYWLQKMSICLLEDLFMRIQNSFSAPCLQRSSK